jgi:Transposase DDE domain group 1
MHPASHSRSPCESSVSVNALEIYELLDTEGIRYAIRLPADQVLQRRIGHLLTRPVGRPPKQPIVSLASFHYQAKGWTRARRVVAKVEWHQGELHPRVGLIVTNLTGSNKRLVKFYNGRGTAEQWIKEGKTRSAGRGSPATPSGTTPCGSSSMRSPTTSPTSCAR